MMKSIHMHLSCRIFHKWVVTLLWALNLVSKIQFGIEYFFTMIFNSGYEKFVSENPMFAIYARIPTRIFLHEVIFIFLFGVFSSVAATWLASRNILRMTVTEVLRDE